MDAKTRRDVVAALESTGTIPPVFNNWLLFSATIEAALATLGARWDRMRVDYALRQHEQWYRGDGAYSDGPDFHFDYYNSFVIHPMLLDVLDVVRDEMPAWKELAARVERRAQRYAAVLERLIAPDGTFPALGRSLAYRFGAMQLLAQMALRHSLPENVSPAQTRRRTDGGDSSLGSSPWHLRRGGLAAHRLLRASTRDWRVIHLDREPVSVLGRTVGTRSGADRRVLVGLTATVDIRARVVRADVFHRQGVGSLNLCDTRTVAECDASPIVTTRPRRMNGLCPA